MPVVSRSFEHHAGDSTIWLSSFPFLRENPLGWSETSHLSSPSSSTGTIHLQTSLPSPEFEPKPYGTAVSVGNHYTRGVAEKYLKRTDE
ncbi:hypothetical protein TNCV_992591 [Trichonephila clavipes]|nr:hypothetical protein TNCV_992591 [Trichonephila clavipes]